MPSTVLLAIFVHSRYHQIFFRPVVRESIGLGWKLKPFVGRSQRNTQNNGENVWYWVCSPNFELGTAREHKFSMSCEMRTWRTLIRISVSLQNYSYNFLLQFFSFVVCRLKWKSEWCNDQGRNTHNPQQT